MATACKGNTFNATPVWCIPLRAPRFDKFQSNPGTLEERLWRRYTWDFPPADECAKCWWAATEEADQTMEVRLICRRRACLWMDLCDSRLATSKKLRRTLSCMHELFSDTAHMFTQLCYSHTNGLKDSSGISVWRTTPQRWTGSKRTAIFGCRRAGVILKSWLRRPR